MTITEFLQTQVPFLHGINDDQAKLLASSAEQISIKASQTVIFKGVTVEGLHVIATGNVSVFIRPEKNKAWIQVATLGPGEVFGERSILESTTATATIKGAAPESLIFVIPQTAFQELLNSDISFKERTCALIAARTTPAPLK